MQPLQELTVVQRRFTPHQDTYIIDVSGHKSFSGSGSVKLVDEVCIGQ
jgi:hypothetical protein